MNTMTDIKNAPDRTVVAGRHKMTPSEAFVETLVAQGVTDVFGIVGSAYMDALDLFPLLRCQLDLDRLLTHVLWHRHVPSVPLSSRRPIPPGEPCRLAKARLHGLSTRRIH